MPDYPLSRSRPGDEAVRGGAAELLDADGHHWQKCQGVAEAGVVGGDV